MKKLQKIINILKKLLDVLIVLKNSLKRKKNA